MYLKFYQMTKKPFSLAPDPDFLYLSPQHKDALGAIVYGIREREGFISVVGEVGTGKTTIIRTYLQQNDHKNIFPIFIFNSRISFSELLETFLHEIGVDPELIPKRRHVNDMVRLAYQVMLDKLKNGRNLVLIIDEAQNMPVDTLGNLCILSNFETAKAKLVQIVLVGQPELQQKLDLFELRQLRQRIAYKALITPLSVSESYNYFYHRLSLSARRRDAVFTAGAVKRIVKHSKGVPRVINVLSENALVSSYGLQKKPVSSRLVKKIVAEYEGDGFSGKTPFLARFVILILISCVLLLGAYLSLSLYPDFRDKLADFQVYLKIPNGFLVEKTAKMTSVNEQPVVLVKKAVPMRVKNVPTANTETVNNLSAEVTPTRSIALPPEPGLPVVEEQPVPAHALETESLWPDAESMVSLLVEAYRSPRQSKPLVKIIKKGDTVSKLCLDTYGVYNMQIHVWIKSHNPHIENMDQIQIGGIIFFPQPEPLILLHGNQRINSRSSNAREEVALK